MKILIKLLLIIMVLITPVYAVDYVKIPRPFYNKILNQLETLEAIKKAEAHVSIKDLDIIIDKDDRVYIKDTVSVTIKVAELQYKGDLTTIGNIKVYKYNKDKFISRFGLLYVAQHSDNTSILTNTFTSDIYVFYDMFKLNKISLNLVGNFRRWGAGIGYRLTPNTKVVFGTNWRYTKSLKGNTKLFLGVGFNF